MNKNPISINYSNEKLRILVEEYITQQQTSFTLKGVCSYVLYWAMEDGYTAGVGLYEGNKLNMDDCERINSILKKIEREGRISSTGDVWFEKLAN